MKKINFNPVSTVNKLLNVLDERPKDILEKRFGLLTGKPKTLESIGREYGITRERVRQIEYFALNKIRQSDAFEQTKGHFDELETHINEEGSLVEEKDFLAARAKQEEHKPHLLFLLVLGNSFNKFKEDDHFNHSWATDLNKAEVVREALKQLHLELNEETLLAEKDIVEKLEEKLVKSSVGKMDKENLLSLLKTSRVVSKNALGEWGKSSSSYISPRGMRDCAFLVMRKHGSPMHFSEVAASITETFKKPAHRQTVHNELIKDERFVLVGRGLYALKEWGYKNGIVRNVIEKILKDSGPLSKDEIIKKVLRERYVKENTVLVNLQNRNFFKKDEGGNYMLL